MFDVGEVETRVQQTLQSNSNNPEDSRQIYLAEIMDWTDYYTENTEASPAERERVFSSIVRLWVSSTQFEISLHQFKKAVDLYEQAISDPVVGKSSLIFQSYADFCVERKKLSNAQKVYVKALTADLPASEIKSLWDNFLALMHTVNGTTDMTLVQLHAAVQKQLGDKASTLSAIPGVAPIVKAEEKIIAAEDSAALTESMDVQINAQEQQQALNTVMDSLFEVGGPKQQQQMMMQGLQDLQQGDNAPTTGDDLDNVAGLTPEQVIMIYDRRPPMIFTASNKEPMASGISALSPSQQAELEKFLGGVSLASMATSEGHNEDRQMDQVSVADKYQDLLEVLWSTQAMKERHFDSWFSDLQMMHIRDESSFLDALSAREPPGTSERELRIRHQAETVRFNNRGAVQKELLNAVVNKTLFTLLLEQQTLLAQISFPQFSVSFNDRIRNFLKRQASGSKAASFIAAQNAEFEAISDHVAKQRVLVCALLSIRLSVVHNQRNRANTLHRKQLRLSLTREHSVDLTDDSVDNSPGMKMKKRRQLIDQQHGTDSYGHSAVSSYNNGGVGSPRYNQHQQLLQQQQAYLMQMQMNM